MKLVIMMNGNSSLMESLSERILREVSEDWPRIVFSSPVSIESGEIVRKKLSTFPFLNFQRINQCENYEGFLKKVQMMENGAVVFVTYLGVYRRICPFFLNLFGLHSANGDACFFYPGSAFVADLKKRNYKFLNWESE